MLISIRRECYMCETGDGLEATINRNGETYRHSCQRDLTWDAHRSWTQDDTRELYATFSDNRETQRPGEALPEDEVDP